MLIFEDHLFLVVLHSSTTVYNVHPYTVVYIFESTQFCLYFLTDLTEYTFLPTHSFANWVY